MVAPVFWAHRQGRLQLLQRLRLTAFALEDRRKTAARLVVRRLIDQDSA